MKIVSLAVPVLIALALAGTGGFSGVAEARALADTTLQRMMGQIRRDKFDHVLPRAMRDNGVDMWIHVIRDRNPDGLASELGGQSGVFVFTDRGQDRIERAILGHTDEALWEEDAYDILAGEEAFEGDAGWAHVIGEFVAARDPQRIAVNYSGINALADGISHTDYETLAGALGEKYAARIVSAEHVIGDFLAGIVVGQIALAGYFGLITTETIDEEFAKIEVGVTRLEQIDGNVFVRDPDGNENNNNDYVIQPGDIVTILNGTGEGLFVADLGGNGYALRDGETELPERVSRIWDHAMDVRDILRANIRIGPTAGETLETLIGKLEEAGYLYIDSDQYDPGLDPTKTQVHLDLHAQGRRDMDAPRISPLGGDWQRAMRIPLFHSFTLEYMVHMPVPEWGPGKHLYIAFHDGAIVTPRGIEFPYPPDPGMRIIR
ncbi:MAG: hypothetical protein OXP09_13325 [Gammaproteobacteria bacterium]|nr:hypothetical protein [Gammaproteobacteria bacterium]MDE0366544.1 hypothetical protein [Gammaproteobacteria bacterium]